ncbi:MAG: hypothetical protein ABFS56_14240 [Pseudomonadota bacterium]
MQTGLENNRKTVLAEISKDLTDRAFFEDVELVFEEGRFSEAIQLSDKI